MTLENGSRTFNINERFWKAWLIDELIRTGRERRTLKENGRMAKHIDRIAEEDQKA